MTTEARPPAALIAEDQPLASMALRAQLEALGFDVIGPARTGQEAVALGACFHVDVALFDFRMPECSGIEAAEQLFELAPTPIVILTGVGAGDLPDPIPEPPVFHVITKPAGLAELRSGTERAIERFEAWARNRSYDRQGLEAERATIAQAVRHETHDERPATVARRFLDRATRENRPLIEVARDVLATS